ncbi:hypothetical protein HYS91_01160 [Candidatus Daviesbacteria bacterium]|nr:hypothetical protein [Candidatus Daviesbacteria bacterium]
MKLSKEKLLFLLIFSVIGFITLQVPFTKLAGSTVSFTLFDFFAPITGAFLGPVFGVTSVLAVEVINLFIKHTYLTTGSIIRLFPMLFAVLYFSFVSKKKLGSEKIFIFTIPLLAMALFIAHPIGRSVWYYSLFWLIPLITLIKKDNLFLKSLGATFFAHSVGGALWIWAFNLPVSVWNSLIPVVIQERLLFALGIAGSFILVKHTLRFLIEKRILPNVFKFKIS